VDGRQPTTVERSQDWDPVVQLTASGRSTAKSAISHLRQLPRSIIRRSRPGHMDWQRLDHVYAHHQGRGWLLCFATTTAQRTTVSVARVFYKTRGRRRASTLGLLQRSPGWTSCQLTQPTAVRSPRGSATDLRRPSLRPRYTTAAAVALAVSARTSDIHTLRHGVLLSAWYRPWILLGGLKARVRDLLSPATAFGLQYRRRGSCHTPVFTWQPSIPGRRSSSVERDTAQCHLRTIFVLIPTTPEYISFPATMASITLITVSWSWSALALSITLILANWTELNSTQIYGFCQLSDVNGLADRVSTCFDGAGGHPVSEAASSKQADIQDIQDDSLGCGPTIKDWSALVCLWSTIASDLDFASTYRQYLCAASILCSDLVVHIDSDVSLRTHVTATVRSHFAALRQIRSIQRCLPQPASTTSLPQPCWQ